MEKHVVFIDGAEGTTGLRIHERLHKQPDIELLTLQDAERKNLNARLQAAQQADVTILCLPDAAAKEFVAAAPQHIKICDASTAHRTVPGWVYGFAELKERRQAIQTANRVSVPGCHATGFLALVTPLVQQNILPAGTAVHATSITGYSGGGKGMIAAYNQKERPNGYTSPRLYGLTMQHKHLPEMKAISGLEQPPVFLPLVADYYSGMLVSVPLQTASLAKGYNTPAAIAAALQQYYRGQPLITVYPAGAVAPEDTMLPANALAGKDNMEIFVLGSEEQILLTARFDNLGKGASGAAVQCINLMLGRGETTGLEW